MRAGCVIYIFIYIHIQIYALTHTHTHVYIYIERALFDVISVSRPRSRFARVNPGSRVTVSARSVICVSSVPTGWGSRSHGDTTRGDEPHTDHRSSDL